MNKRDYNYHRNMKAEHKLKEFRKSQYKGMTPTQSIVCYVDENGDKSYFNEDAVNFYIAEGSKSLYKKFLKRQSNKVIRRNNTDYSNKSNRWKREFDLWWIWF